MRNIQSFNILQVPTATVHGSRTGFLGPMALVLLAAVALAQVPGYGAPNYTVTYQMNRSTVVMPCNYSGFLDKQNLAPYGGLIDVDWSNSKQQWTKHQPMDDESMLMAQMRSLRVDDPGRKLWVYRGTIYAYPWYAETRKILDDPAYEPWFLHFRTGNGTVSPRCDVNASTAAARKCTDYYHTQEQTPMFPSGPDDRGVCAAPGCDCGTKPCGFYMYNHTAHDVVVKGQTLREWFIESYVLARSDGVDGYCFDDYWNDWRSPVTEDYAPGMVEDVGFLPSSNCATSRSRTTPRSRSCTSACWRAGRSGGRCATAARPSTRAARRCCLSTS